MTDNIQQKLEKLKKYNGNPDPVLSVYLGENGKKSPSSKYFVTEFKSLVKKKLTDKDKKLFKKDIEKIKKYLQEFFDSHGKRSVVFFTSGKDLWEVFEFEFPVPDYCSVSNKPFLEPLLKSIVEHDKYLVLLADRQKARLFTVHLGVIEEQKDIFNKEVPKKVNAVNEAWGRQDKILRHIEYHLHRHINLILEKTKEFARNKHINFLIIGGHEQIFSKILKHLPFPLSKKVVGIFVTELNIPINEVFLKSKEAVQKMEK